MSNKAEPHRKFVQTFVLAEQPSGYYVLNDVFRYIILDEEEFENGLMAPESVEAPAAAGSTEVDSVRETVVASQQPDLEQVDEKLEEDASAGAQGTDDEHVNGLVVTDATGVSAEGVTSASSVAPQGSPDTTVDPSKVEAVEPTAQPEEPKDPAPSPVPAVAKSQSAPEPPKPAAPKTWANLVAANRTTAVLQVTAPTQAPAGSSNIIPKTKPQTSSKEAVTPPAPVSEEVAAKGQPNGNAEWQTAGSSNDKRQNRQHSQSVSGNQETVLGYVKNVTDKVDASILKEKLNQLGKLTYFDVSRQKVSSSTALQTLLLNNHRIVRSLSLPTSLRTTLSSRPTPLTLVENR